MGVGRCEATGYAHASKGAVGVVGMAKMTLQTANCRRRRARQREERARIQAKRGEMRCLRAMCDAFVALGDFVCALERHIERNKEAELGDNARSDV